MKILAIDTATQVCSAALMLDDKIIEHSENAPRQHAKLILPMINELLAQADISLAQLDCVAFSAGPGSFTGIRIATGVIQGLAYAKDLPVVPVSTLATLAQGAYQEYKAKYILAALDARMHQVYWGAYQTNKQGFVEPMIDDLVVDPDKIIIPKSKIWIGIGSGWKEYTDALTKKVGEQLDAVYPELYPLAKDILPLAKNKFAKKEYVSAENALPVYLRDKVV